MNEAGDTPFHLECTSGDLEMIKCLDDGKGNLDSKYNILRGSFLSVSNDRLLYFSSYINLILSRNLNLMKSLK